MLFENIGEKITEAVMLLTTSTKSLQERLIDVYLSLFHNFELDEEESGLFIYEEIKEELTGGLLQSNEEAISAKIHAMSNDEARRFIEKIIVLYDVVIHACWQY